MNNGDDAKEDPSDSKDGELKRKEPGQGEDVKTEDLALPSEPEDIFQDLHESRTFLSTVSLHKNDAKVCRKIMHDNENCIVFCPRIEMTSSTSCCMCQLSVELE